jgi:hypothetical protein
MDKEIESFKNMTVESRAKIELIKKALNQTQFKNKVAETNSPNGSKIQIFETLDKNGKQVYRATENDKNVMTFSTKKQLLNYLKDK